MMVRPGILLKTIVLTTSLLFALSSAGRCCLSVFFRESRSALAAAIFPGPVLVASSSASVFSTSASFPAVASASAFRLF